MTREKHETWCAAATPCHPTDDTDRAGMPVHRPWWIGSRADADRRGSGRNARCPVIIRGMGAAPWPTGVVPAQVGTTVETRC